MKNEQQIWIITDTHLGHENMVKYCGRPENHSEIILAALQKVKSGDVLIHLGDICMGKDEMWNKFLHEATVGALKILVMGNHDNKSVNWYLTHGWNMVFKNGVLMSFFGKRILFSHIPQERKGDWDLNIHGHYHNALPRLLKGDFVVEGERERNGADFDLKKYNHRYHRLLVLEETEYSPTLLKEFIP